MLALYEPNSTFVFDTGETVKGLEEIRKALTPFLDVEDLDLYTLDFKMFLSIYFYLYQVTHSGIKGYV